jgi:hypothetical protein
MIAASIEICPSFGWDTEYRLLAKEKLESFRRTPATPLSRESQLTSEGERFIMRFSQVVKIAGYIPLLNVIVGIARIAFFALRLSIESRENSEALSSHKWQIARGVCEMIAGPLLFIVDAFITGVEQEWIAGKLKDMETPAVSIADLRFRRRTHIYH